MSPCSAWFGGRPHCVGGGLIWRRSAGAEERAAPAIRLHFSSCGASEAGHQSGMSAESAQKKLPPSPLALMAHWYYATYSSTNMFYR